MASLNIIRRRLYLQLDPAARPQQGLSPLNTALVAMIFVAVGAAIVETEPAVAAGRESFFRFLETVLGLIFLFEYAGRLWVAVENPKCAGRLPRLRYALTPLAIIDLLAVLPLFFSTAGGATLVLRFFRVLRMFRLAKLGRTSRAWQHICDAVYQRRHEFVLIVGVLALAILVSASLLYLAEAEAQPDKFGSIPRALWWAVVTLTTVGYGDVYPVTALGRFFAGFIAIMGVTVIALPTGIFAASFSEAMQRHRAAAEEPAEPQERP